MIPFWRLSEGGEDNLGLAVADHGLRLGRTPLIERRDDRFAVRDRSELERLLKHNMTAAQRAAIEAAKARAGGFGVDLTVTPF